MGPNIVTNGGFDASIAGWVLNNNGGTGTFTFVAGAGKIISGTQTCFVTQQPFSYAMNTGNDFVMDYDLTVSVIGVSGIQPQLRTDHSGDVGFASLRTVSGHYRETISAATILTYASDPTNGIDFAIGSGFTGTIDNVEIHELFGNTPAYNPSLVSSIARVQQGNAGPKFVIGGKGGSGATTFALFKKASTYAFNPWRSEVFHVGHPFIVREIKIPLTAVPSGNVEVIPVLYFDNGQIASVGTAINATNYIDPVTSVIALTADNFPDGARGTNNCFLELQFTGSDLIGVRPGPDFTITIETEDI